MNKEENLRRRLFDIIKQHAVSRTGKEHFSSNLTTIKSVMTMKEWNSFCSKWNRYLKKLGVIMVKNPGPPTFLSGSFINGPPKSLLPHRNIPGFYSVLDPVSFPVSVYDPAVPIALDIPREVGDTILVLGQLPNS